MVNDKDILQVCKLNGDQLRKMVHKFQGLRWESNRAIRESGDQSLIMGGWRVVGEKSRWSQFILAWRGRPQTQKYVPVDYLKCFVYNMLKPYNKKFTIAHMNTWIEMTSYKFNNIKH